MVDQVVSLEIVDASVLVGIVHVLRQLTYLPLKFENSVKVLIVKLRDYCGRSPGAPTDGHSPGGRARPGSC